LVEHASSAVHLNMTSASLAMARELGERHRKAGTSYVAAPVFGRPEFAAQGQLDIVAAGPAGALARCEPVFAALGRRWFDVGTDAHQANVVKIARNLVLATVIESLGEAFALVRACGGSADRFLDIITSTSMNAPAYKDYGRRILHAPPAPTFALHLGLKDIELALAAARDSGLALDNAELIGRFHRAAIDAGYGEKDWADLGNWIIEYASRRKAMQ
jgi:3-hydroxyisobutyrate dehydrogenase-like beta-hydroxyacid dehydrogenase